MEDKSKKKKRKKGKIIAIICAIAAAAFVIADIVIGNYLVSFAIQRGVAGQTNVAPEPETADEAERIIRENYEMMEAKKDEWLKTADRETVSVVSDDGLRLEGDIFKADKDSHRWVIAVHGYSGTRSTMYSSAMVYGDRDYNILTPDMRAHGKSEGDYIGMGWPDRKDMLKWIDLIIQRDPDAKIVLHGVSMGAATVMMTVGEKLPSNVKLAIEDCGYTSVWDIFSDEAKYLFHIPEFPILHTASAFSKLRAGYSFTEASAIEQVKKAEIPMLFIHGSKDNFVRSDMVYEVYEACPAKKRIYVAEGAGHGMSFFLNPERYTGEVVSFLEEAGM